MPDRYTLIVVDVLSFLGDEELLQQLLKAFEQDGIDTPFNNLCQYDVVSGPTLDNCYYQLFMNGWSSTNTITTWHDREEIR